MPKKTKTPEQLLTGAIITALRRVWMMSKERTAALKRCKVDGRGNGWRCEHCGAQVNASKLLNVHHIVPVGHLDNWDNWIHRMFCGVDGYKVVCVSCHLLIHRELEKK